MSKPSKISSRTPRRRLPEARDGVDVNFCRNPLCDQFGSIPYPYDGRGRRGAPGEAALHRVVGPRDNQDLLCITCRTETKIKNNAAIAEELARLERRFARTNRELCCSNVVCINHGLDREKHPDRYVRFGRTKSGQRYRCKACGSTFSEGKPTRRHKKPHVNGRVFDLLTSKMPLTRIARRTGLGPAAVYDKIGFLYEQCRAFMADRDSRISELRPRRWQLSTDRQDINVNWPTRSLRASIQIGQLVTVDRRSGYILAVHPQFDPDIDPVAHEKIVAESGDLNQRRPFRRYGRLWTQAEYERYLAPQVAQEAAVRQRIDAAMGRDGQSAQETAVLDPEREADQPNDERQLPTKGAVVHIDVLQHAHFQYVRRLLGDSVTTLLYSIDEDAGIANACVSAFKDLIANGQAQVAMVRFNKNRTIDEKRIEAAEVAARLQPHREALPLFPRWILEETLLANELQDRLASLGDQRSAHLARRWIEYPYTTMAEPGKCVRLLTGGRGLDWLAMGRAYRQASLHPVDRVMMLFRRMTMGLERGVATPRSGGRVWGLYAYYDPSMVEKVTTIYRMLYNYMEPGEDKKTPAMRLGLAKGVVYMRDLLRF